MDGWKDVGKLQTISTADRFVDSKTSSNQNKVGNAPKLQSLDTKFYSHPFTVIRTINSAEIV